MSSTATPTPWLTRLVAGQAGQLQQAMAFFGSAAADAPREGAFVERRASTSPLRSARPIAAPLHGQARALGTGTHGNFRPY